MIKLLCLEDTKALFDFENRNKAWFESWVSARPAAYFDGKKFPAVLATLIQDMSPSNYLLYVQYVQGKIVGRFNFTRIEADYAEIGYRVCQEHLGQGLASEGVAFLKNVATQELKVNYLMARTATNNFASSTVLLRQGFSKDPNYREELEHPQNGKNIILEKYVLYL